MHAKPEAVDTEREAGDPGGGDGHARWVPLLRRECTDAKEWKEWCKSGQRPPQDRGYKKRYKQTQGV